MTHDYILAGAGLAGGLVALAVRHFQPTATVLVLEQADQPAGNHTWAFHAQDVPAAAEPFVRPLIDAAWPAYQVRFPNHNRVVDSPYAVVSSARFAEVLLQSGCEVRSRAQVAHLSANWVELADGREFRGRCVLDARGPDAGLVRACGFQKFLGLEIETEQPWPDQLPTIMDATVPQDDGYRFVYVLPFEPRRVLIEDTYFSDSPHLDRTLLRTRVEEQIQARGLQNWRVLREESGVLPMPWSGGAVAVNRTGPFPIGYAGGWFHPATGYSFPLAVRVALAVAQVAPEQAGAALKQLARQMAPRQQFARFLNRLLFTLVTPSGRWQVFRRLYRTLPAPVLARFYASEFGRLDAGRLVIGWPPPVSPLRLIARPEVLPCPQPTP